MARPKKKSMKGILNRGPELWCGIIKIDGTPCRSPKKTGLDTCAQHKNFSKNIDPLNGVEAFLPGQRYDLPPDMPLETIDDGVKMLSQAINWTHQGKLPTKIGNTMAVMMDKWIKLVIAREKYDENKIAKRAFTREAAIEMARTLTRDEAMRIIQERSSMLTVQAKSIEQPVTISVESKEAEALVSTAERQVRAVERQVDNILKLRPELDEILQGDIEHDDTSDIDGDDSQED